MSKSFSRSQCLREAALVREALSGALEAVEELASRLRHVPRALHALNRRWGGPLGAHDLEDLSQDTLVRIWQKLETFVGQATLEMWIQKFCYLEFMNRLRSRGRHLGRVAAADPEELPARASSDFTLAEYALLEEALDELGPPGADVIRLKYFEGLTFNEIGDHLELSPSTAKTHFYRGILWLQRHLPPRADSLV